MMKDAGKHKDWEAIKKRLQTSQRALEIPQGENETELEAIYRQRAAQLASRTAPGQSAAVERLRMLIVVLGSERYALEFSALIELLPFAHCTKVPGGPPALLGVINVHGELRSVVDLGRLLELPCRERLEGGYVLLMRGKAQEIALRVDRIDTIEHLDPAQLASGQVQPGAGETTARSSLLCCVTPERLRVVNTQALLAHPLYQGP